MAMRRKTYEEKLETLTDNFNYVITQMRAEREAAIRESNRLVAQVGSVLQRVDAMLKERESR